MIDQQPRSDAAAATDNRIGPVARYDDVHEVLWIAEMPIPFRRGDNTSAGNNSKLLQLLGMTIRSLRGLSADAPCPLRRAEHQLLAELLDLDEPRLRSDLRSHLGLSRRETGDVVTQLRRVRVDNAIMLD